MNIFASAAPLLRRVKQLGAFVCVAAFGAPLLAQNLPSGFAESPVVNFSANAMPTNLEFAPDGRIFVCLKLGQLRVIKGGTLLPTPFLSVNVSSANERGLLGVAFDPNFATNHYLYVYYTVPTSPIHNRVSRFTADPNNPDIALAGSEVILIEMDPVTTSYHNSGDIHFGADGKLYINVGNDTVGTNSQSLGNTLGKILRINPDGTVPNDNPFVNDPNVVGINKAIWTYGLRNPFKSALQRGTNKIYILDVGEETWEEINEGAAGANFGWPNYEGASNATAFTTPTFAYGHGDGDVLGRAITGGAFYNPPSGAAAPFPSSYTGKFFYADYVNCWIRLMDPATKTASAFATAVAPNLVDLEVGPDGSLYYLTLSATPPLTPAIYKIQYTGLRSPQIGTQPADRTVAVGQSATFSMRVSGDQPMNFQWTRDGVPISGANAISYTTPATSFSDSGRTYSCVVSNSFGTATSAAAKLTVTSNSAPVAVISNPPSGTMFNAGDTIFFGGGGSDAEDGTLPASACTWQVDFQHDTHAHPGFLPATTGIKSGTFTTATTGETSDNIWYRIYLTVTDSLGVSSTTYRDVLPNKSTVTLASNPPGLGLTLDGQSFTGPFSTLGVVGMNRPIGVVSPQTVNGTTYQFESWSDGGAATHNLVWPSGNTTLTATFRDSSTITNDASFVSQDAPTSMVSGRNYMVAVTMKNTGTSLWPAGSEYRLGAISPYDNTNWGFNRVNLSSPVSPGQSTTFNFVATAPDAPGNYDFQWRMVQEGREWFGATTPVIPISVSASPNNAEFVSQNVPTSMVGGHNYNVSVSLKNTGTNTWRSGDGYMLGSQGPQDNLNWGFNRASLGANVQPGQVGTFNFTVTAPSTTAGLFIFQWRMLQDNVEWFGALTDPVSINVSTADNAGVFVTQALSTTMAAGRGYDIRITMKNTGTTTWSSAQSFRLGAQNPSDNTVWGSSRVNLPGSVPPGSSVMIPFNIVAPSTPGTYNFQWRLVQDGVGWFGEWTDNVAIAVGVGPTITSQPQNVTVAAGATATFNVTATGPNLTYQWQKNGNNISGATSPGYTTPPVSPSDAGATFRCVVSNTFRSEFSNSAILSTTPANDAVFVSQSVPASMLAGKTYNVAVTMQNTGVNTWTYAGTYKLGSENPRDNTTWGFNRVRVSSSASVAQGANYTFNYSVTAPSTPGTYNFRWRMLQETGGWFGPLTPNVSVTVSQAPTPTPTPAAARNASFVTQAVPTTMLAGHTYSVSVTMKNTGTDTWTFPDKYKLGSQNPRDNNNWGFNRVRLGTSSSVPQGSSYTFSFSVTAPAARGNCHFQWQMLQDGVAWFGSMTPDIVVNVQ